MSSEKKLSLSELLLILVQNFLFMFMFTGAIGFTMAALKIFNPAEGIYRFTIAFSVMWGVTAAAAAWSRNAEHIKTPGIFDSILEAAGVPDEGKKMLDFCFRAHSGFKQRAFIPFVHIPE